MKTNLFSLTAMLLAGIMVSCQQAEEPQVNEGMAEISTRAYGDKSPKMVVYVETNDTNPLNAGDYELSNGKHSSTSSNCLLRTSRNRRLMGPFSRYSN